jgi:hypothetical protein
MMNIMMSHINKLVLLCYNEIGLRLSCAHEVISREFERSWIDLVCQFYIEIRQESRKSELGNRLNQSFTDAYSLTSQERGKAVRVAFLTSWSEEVLRLRVKSLRNEFAWLLPFFRIVP